MEIGLTAALWRWSNGRSNASLYGVNRAAALNNANIPHDKLGLHSPALANAMRQAPAPVYRFDGFEIDPSRASFVKDGVEQRLRPKTFSLLIHLLEHRDRVISKEEFFSELWAGVAVTDDALTQCVSELRKVLGDDPRNPRYLRTIPKQGFLFIGTVEEVEVEAAPAVVLAAAVPWWWRRRVWMAAVFCAAALLGVVFVWRPWTKLSAGASDGRLSVAVMMFENRTGRQDLEWMREALPDMLIGSLARSAKLSLLPREQIVDLEQRTKTAGGRVGLENALGMARKSRAQAFVLGAYTVLGEAMRLELRVFQTSDGRLLASEALTVDRQDDLLTRFEGLAMRTAVALHAPLPSSRTGAAAEARTTSLEAYRLYTLGVDRADHFRHSEAVALFERALEIDPNFYMASARIGYTHAFIRGLGKAGLPYLQKALEQASWMNARDRLFVEAWRSFAEGDVAGAIARYQRIVREYPNEITAYVALARLLRGEKRLEEGRDMLQRALALDPDWADAHNLLAGIQFGLGQKESALVSAIRYTELNPEEPNSHDSLGVILHRMGQYQEAIQSYRQALALKPDFDIAMIHLGNTLVHLGRYREAVTQYRQFGDTTKTDEQKARSKDAIAWVLWKSGNADGALQEVAYEPLRQVILLEKQPTKTAPVQVDALIPTEFNSRGARPSRRLDLVLRGLLYLNGQHNGELAIREMQAALRELPLYYAQSDLEDCLGETYLKLGKNDEAAAEYRRVLGLHPNLAMGHYGLALALDNQRERESARSEFRKFLEVWKDADRDLPQYLDAVSRLR